MLTTRYPDSIPSHRRRALGLGLTVSAHVALLAALLAYAPAREALRAMAPIMVSLITPPSVEPPREKPTMLPKPLPLKRTPEPPKPQPLVAAATEVQTANIVAVQPEPPRLATPIETPPPRPSPPALASLPITPPRFDAAYLDNPAPTYPPLARRLGEQGKVILRVLVSTAGTAEKIELRASSGSTRLDTTALDTVRHWRFVPARQGSEAVAAWVLVPISFSLQG